MKIRSLLLLLPFILTACNKKASVGSTTYEYRQPEPAPAKTAQGIQPPANTKIYHDPDADFKQRRGQTHNRTYLKNELDRLNLNIDSLQNVVEHLNRDTRDKEWEYQISTVHGTEGKILRFYKSHRNADGSSGRTIYGEERRRMPRR